MGDRQALRIDYAHGTVPGTAFVIDEPFPIPACQPRVPSVEGPVSGIGGSAGTFGLPSTGSWDDQPPPPRRDEASWGSRDWAPPQPLFPDGGRFRGDDGAPRRPNGSYMRGPFRGGGRGHPGMDMEDDSTGGFRGGRGQRPGMGGFRGRGMQMQRGFPGGGRGRGMGADDADITTFRGRGMRGGPGGGRGRGMGADETDTNTFRGRGMRGGPGGGRGRGMGAEETNHTNAFRGRGMRGGPGGGRGRGGFGVEDTDNTNAFRSRGIPGQRGIGGRGRGMTHEDSEHTFRRGGTRGQPPQRGSMGRGMRGDNAEPFRGRGRGARGHDSGESWGRGPPAALQESDKSFTPKPLSKHATPGKILTSQIPPLVKHPPVSKFRNRFPGSDESSRSPSPRSPGSKNAGTKLATPAPGTTAGEVADATMTSPPASKSKSPPKDRASKSSPEKSTSKTRSPGKSSSRTRSPRKSSSRTRSPGRRNSRTRSSSKSRSRRSRSRSRRRSRTPPRRHRSRSRSPYRHRSRSRSPHRHRSPRPARSPYRPSPLLAGQDECFGVRVMGFPVRVSDRSVQDTLYHEFKRHGKVISVDMHGCAEDRYAVVFYQFPTEREAALAAFKGHCFFGRSVQMEPWDASTAGLDIRSWEGNASFQSAEERADEFHSRATKILFVGNLEKTLTREDLSTVFQRYGEILGIDLKKMVGLPNRFAFIQYIDIASVCRAIKAMDGELLRNTRLRLGFGRSKPTNCVWVDGLPETLTEAQLTAHFSAHGTVLKLSFDPAKGVALVFFKTVEQAEAALQEARGQTVGGKRIKVDFANARSQAAFYRVTEPGPDDGVDVEPDLKSSAPPFQEFKPSDIEAGDVLRKVLLV